MRGPRPGAPEGPGRKKMCSPQLAHPGPHWRPRMEQGIKTDHPSRMEQGIKTDHPSRMEQGIKTDHPWIYLNNNKLY